jgi:hypothetical protein
MADFFGAAFSNDDKHGYCFDYNDWQCMRSKSLPRGLDEQLQKIRKIEGTKLASLSIGLDSRYWLKYTKGDETFSCVYYRCA